MAYELSGLFQYFSVLEQGILTVCGCAGVRVCGSLLKGYPGERDEN